MLNTDFSSLTVDQINEMVAKLTAEKVSAIAREKNAALKQYEADKLDWAAKIKAACKGIGNAKITEVEALFDSLPTKPIKPAILLSSAKVTNGNGNGNSGDVTKKVYQLIDNAGTSGITKKQICADGNLNVNTVGRLLRPAELRMGYTHRDGKYFVCPRPNTAGDAPVLTGDQTGNTPTPI